MTNDDILAAFAELPRDDLLGLIYMSQSRASASLKLYGWLSLAAVSVAAGDDPPRLVCVAWRETELRSAAQSVAIYSQLFRKTRRRRLLTLWRAIGDCLLDEVAERMECAA
jgi:hypothetical protein